MLDYISYTVLTIKKFVNKVEVMTRDCVATIFLCRYLYFISKNKYE